MVTAIMLTIARVLIAIALALFIYKTEQYHMTNLTKGHLAGSGGVRGHSAGDIFPYIIMIVGSFNTGFKYHVIGNGLIQGRLVWGSYEAAHDCTVVLLS